MKCPIFVTVIAVAALSLPRDARAQDAGPAARWWADVKALAHDSMRGRDTGSPEHHKAALYIAAAFKAAGSGRPSRGIGDCHTVIAGGMPPTVVTSMFE